MVSWAGRYFYQLLSTWSLKIQKPLYTLTEYLCLTSLCVFLSGLPASHDSWKGRDEKTRNLLSFRLLPWKKLSTWPSCPNTAEERQEGWRRQLSWLKICCCHWVQLPIFWKSLHSTKRCNPSETSRKNMYPASKIHHRFHSTPSPDTCSKVESNYRS